MRYLLVMTVANDHTTQLKCLLIELFGKGLIAGVCPFRTAQLGFLRSSNNLYTLDT